MINKRFSFWIQQRWLRQAMFESCGPSESRSPVHSGGASSPNPSCGNSPGASPPGRSTVLPLLPVNEKNKPASNIKALPAYLKLCHKMDHF